ncbi:MAG: hypothetical protein K2N72_08660 [Oscillospiraceae bacterium]|nr:hypothetical protein [Oscillospiraceae bacterium]
MNDEDQTLAEKIQDKLADLGCIVKEKLDNISVKFKYWKINPIVVFSLIFVAVFIIVIAAATGGKNEVTEFTASCESGYEDKVFTMKEDKLTVTMRVSDIRRYDSKTGKSYSSTVYSDDYDSMMVIADFIFTNSGNEDIVLDNSRGSGLYMGYAHDSNPAYDENSRNDHMAGAELYLSAEEKPEFNYSVTIGGKSSVEQRFCFIYWADVVNKINSLYICSDYDDKNDDNIYAVWGAGVPWVSFRFKNETFFPVLVKGVETEPAARETASTQTTRSTPPEMSVRYPWSTVSADSSALSSYNSQYSDYYSLSLKVSAQKGASAVWVTESGYSYSADNAARVGGMAEINCDGEVDGVELRFKITEEAKKNTLGTYAKVSDEFKGIKRLNVFMYFEDINMLLPIETYFDETTSEVIARVDTCGSFCLMDMELWFDSLGISPEDSVEQ